MIKQQERRGRELTQKETARQLAALRPPPKPPNCPDLPGLADLRVEKGQLVDVRIFRFAKTSYYIPSAWLRLRAPTYGAVDGIDKLDLGRFDPDLHEIECPGVVHQVTNGGLYMARHAGISFRPGVGAQESATASGVLLYAHKLRRPGELDAARYQQDGLIASMNHKTLDAYVRVASDVGVRLDWHPTHMSKEGWSAQYREWSAGPLIRVSPKPWEALLKTKEFTELTSGVRELHTWLSTPPNRRHAEPPI